MAAENWYTSGAQVNPVANAILADTGPQTYPTSGDGSGTLNFTVIAASTVAAVLVLELRDAGNANTLKSQVIPLQANLPFQSIKNIAIPLAGGERLRVRLNAAITGQCQASIITQ